MHGVEFIVSDDHFGLRAARQTVLPGAKWQRCQFHLAQNAIHHAPNQDISKRIGGELRAVWNAHDLDSARAELNRLAGFLCQGGTEVGDVAGKQHSRGADRLRDPGASSSPDAHVEPHRASRLAGNQTPHRKGSRLPERRRAPAPRHSRPRRDRRGMGHNRSRLYRHGPPECLISVRGKLQTPSCAITKN